MGTAVYRACQDAKVQLTEVAAAQLDVKPHELHFVNGQVFVQCQKEKTISLAALVRITIGRGGNGPVIGRGTVNNQHSAPIFAVQMAEVEVDRETGKVKLLSFAAAQDVGFAINPTLIEGQIQGAVAQGIGRSFMEDYAFRNGIMQNPNFLDYRMPTSVDLPFIDTLLVEVKSEMEPYGVRGVGEPPMIPTTAAVANAVHSATGVRIKNLPMTPEQVLKALKSKNR
jgi:CO/xanthine dehydrogenase Mo-binding subunit